MLFVWIVLSLVIVSLSEYVAHRWVMHTPRIMAFWKPHALHHNKYYQQFDHESDPAGKHFNLRIGWGDTLLGCLIASPLALFAPGGYAVLFAFALLHRWTWNAIHSEMHLNEGRWFTRLRVYRYLKFWHFLHHRQQGKNFNVTLPLFDHIFGTAATPTAEDLEIWNAPIDD